MASASTNVISARTCLDDAEESLRQLPKSTFKELQSFSKPPLACLAIIGAVGILLEPSKQTWEWTDDKKLMAGSYNQFLERLFHLDKDNISSEQLTKINKILNQMECQPSQLEIVSALCHKLGAWLRAIVAYATQLQQSLV